MSELRTKLLELAIQAGATIENATKVATDWERWATEDDPLRLEAPPVEWKHENEIAPDEYWRTHSILHGIDWGRPQLVKSNLSGCIIKTNGVHEVNTFSGVVIQKGYTAWPAVGDSEYEWLKSNFTYHGEIPQEQPKEPQCANAKDGDGACGLSCCICAKEEPKTTGLNFLEAIRLLRSGRGVERPRTEKQFLSQYGVKGKKLCYLDTRLFATLNMDDFLATDWQIVKS